MKRAGTLLLPIAAELLLVGVAGILSPRSFTRPVAVAVAIVLLAVLGAVVLAIRRRDWIAAAVTLVLFYPLGVALAVGTEVPYVAWVEVGLGMAAAAFVIWALRPD